MWQQIWGEVVGLVQAYLQFIAEYNSERIIKIDLLLSKLSWK